LPLLYCGEFGRQSPNADHGRGIIADDLDRFGHCFIAVEAGETIGTLRLNLTSEGPLGMVEELYGMRSSPHYPAATSVCTKFIVEKAKRWIRLVPEPLSSMIRKLVIPPNLHLLKRSLAARAPNPGKIIAFST
jgi:hypothetical protein